MSGYLDAGTFKLGFGLMRLPKNADGSIDVPQVCQMADKFLEELQAFLCGPPYSFLL